MRFNQVFLYSIIVSIGFVADLLAFSIPDSIPTLPEFRDIKWSASLSDVEEKETAQYLQKFSGFGIEALSYEGTIAGMKARIDYTFKNHKFTEGSYTVISKDNFRGDFLTLLSFLQNRYGNPGYRSGLIYSSDSVWIKIDNFGTYVGPAYYWVFYDGFIGLVSEKSGEEISLTILFVLDLTVDEYNSKNSVELINYNVIRLNIE